MNGLMAVLISIVPFAILFVVASVFFSFIFQIKKNSDLQIEQNKQIIAFLEKIIRMIKLFIQNQNDTNQCR